LSELDKIDLENMCDCLFHVKVVNVMDDYLESNHGSIIELEFLDGPLNDTNENYDISVEYKK